MGDLSITQSKWPLSEVVERAVGGEVVRITWCGEPSARIVAATALRRPLEVPAIVAMVKAMKMKTASSGDLIRQLRDAGRS